MDESSQSAKPPWDPTFLHARREAGLILGVWAACLLWAVPFCYLTGYMDLAVGDLPQLARSRVWGMPAWVFWGVVTPWLLANVVTVWFCFRFLRLDDLGPAPEQSSEPEQPGTSASPGN